MKYVADHDYHIHSFISPCSSDENQIPENILKCAEENGFKKLILTDHFWDTQAKGDKTRIWRDVPYGALAKALPLPQGENTEFLFGCEVDMDENMDIGIHRDNYDKFDFIIIPTTHMHLWYKRPISNEERAKLYIERFNKILEGDFPFHKIGIAHLTCSLLSNWETHLDVLDLVSDKDFEVLFKGAKEKGCGIELNIPIFKYKEDEMERAIRPYKIAKDCGCKFYFGSDAHTLNEFKGIKENFEYIIDILDLEETDKFIL